MIRLLVFAAAIVVGFVLVDAFNLFETTHTVGGPGCSVTLTIDNRGNVERETTETSRCWEGK